MEYLKIRNWIRWQSYRSDRGRPPWIKIHRCLMSNPEWVQLSDAQRGRLVLLWILAAERDGEIPADPKLLRKICFMDEEPEIELFIEYGFIESGVTLAPTGCHGDAKVTPQKQSRSEAEADKKKRGRAVNPPVSFASDSQMETMNDMATERGLVLAGVLKSLGMDKALARNVTAIMAHIRETKRIDPEKEAIKASNAVLRLLTNEMTSIIDARGFDAGRAFARSQSEKAQQPLLNRVAKLEAEHG